MAKRHYGQEASWLKKGSYIVCLFGLSLGAIRFRLVVSNCWVMKGSERSFFARSSLSDRVVESFSYMLIRSNLEGVGLPIQQLMMFQLDREHLVAELGDIESISRFLGALIC